jgi:hypothetical protein
LWFPSFHTRTYTHHLLINTMVETVPWKQNSIYIFFLETTIVTLSTKAAFGSYSDSSHPSHLVSRRTSLIVSFHLWVSLSTGIVSWGFPSKICSVNYLNSEVSFFSVQSSERQMRNTRYETLSYTTLSISVSRVYEIQVFFP